MNARNFWDCDFSYSEKLLSISDFLAVVMVGWGSCVTFANSNLQETWSQNGDGVKDDSRMGLRWIYIINAWKFLNFRRSQGWSLIHDFTFPKMEEKSSLPQHLFSFLWELPIVSIMIMQASYICHTWISRKSISQYFGGDISSGPTTINREAANNQDHWMKNVLLLTVADFSHSTS